jgi:hypothetical protein
VDNSRISGYWGRAVIIVVIKRIVGDMPVLAASRHFDRTSGQIVDDFVADDRNAFRAIKANARAGYDQVRTVDYITAHYHVIVPACSSNR